MLRRSQKLTVGLQESPDPRPEPIMLDRLPLGPRNLAQLFPLLLALLDQPVVLVLGSAVLLDDRSECPGEVGQDTLNVALGERGVTDFRLKRMQLDRVLSSLQLVNNCHRNNIRRLSHLDRQLERETSRAVSPTHRQISAFGGWTSASTRQPT